MRIEETDKNHHQIEPPPGNDPAQWIEYALKKTGTAAIQQGITLTGSTKLDVPQLAKMFGRFLDNPALIDLQEKGVITGTQRGTSAYADHPEFPLTEIVTAVVYTAMTKAGKDQHAIKKALRTVRADCPESLANTSFSNPYSPISQHKTR